MKTAAAHNAELTGAHTFISATSLTALGTCPRCHKPYYVVDYSVTARDVRQCLTEPLPRLLAHGIHAPHVDRCLCAP